MQPKFPGRGMHCFILPFLYVIEVHGHAREMIDMVSQFRNVYVLPCYISVFKEQVSGFVCV
jgi:hypothetical protein